MKTSAFGIYGSLAAGLLGLSACASAPLTITSVNTLPAHRGPASSKVDVLYAQGREALVAGDLASALELFHGARRSGPEDIRVLNGLAVIYDRLGRYDLSANYYDRARDLDPNSAVLLANLALSNQMRANQMKSGQSQDGRQEFAQQITPLTPVPSSVSEKPNWALPSTQDVVDISDAGVELARANDAGANANITFDPPKLGIAPAPSLNQIAIVSVPTQAMPSLPAQPSAHQVSPHQVLPRQISPPQPVTQVSTREPSSLKPDWSRPVIVVINGSGIRGQARSTAAQLRETGWVVSRIGNELPFGRAHTLIIYGAGQRQQALMIAQALARESGQTPALSQRLWNTQIHVRLGRDTVTPKRQATHQI
jgi:LytR cell envelope-related transcriptional attenuator/Tetratricopeptide repeat